ncbi:hypothetical protein V6N11_030002 [Hibiscus sabdariffa]|uniref:Uncharacterized protein n=1 Tax=Hibiscus sabdariffa TaxID=183260 RepID=A0ABR2PJL0_9ROSI
MDSARKYGLLQRKPHQRNITSGRFKPTKTDPRSTQTLRRATARRQITDVDFEGEDQHSETSTSNKSELWMKTPTRVARVIRWKIGDFRRVRRVLFCFIDYSLKIENV